MKKYSVKLASLLLFLTVGAAIGMEAPQKLIIRNIAWVDSSGTSADIALIILYVLLTIPPWLLTKSISDFPGTFLNPIITETFLIDFISINYSSFHLFFPLYLTSRNSRTFSNASLKLLSTLHVKIPNLLNIFTTCSLSSRDNRIFFLT